MPKPATPTPSPAELLDLLRDAALLIGAYRRRVREAGYPFAEPPNAAGILAGIDAVCFPDKVLSNESRLGSKQAPAP